jgi:hypothetical protein
MRTRTALIVVLAAGAAALVWVLLPGSSPTGSSRARTASTPAPSSSSLALPDTSLAQPVTTVRKPATAISRPTPAATTASTTVDPGRLAQTNALPSSDSPGITGRIRELWLAIVDGTPAAAAGSFFPLSAYIQVKGISDPVYDYQTRLIPDFDQDIQALHLEIEELPRPWSLVGLTVPAAAQWIQPGVEYNKGSYWRVYGSEIAYIAAGVHRSFPIASMISWRGEWYVVHLSSIR